jgi:hypothetical protein
MATDAGVCAVHGQFEFCHVHKQRNGLAGGVGFEKRVVAVAVQTITVLHTGQRGKRRQCEQDHHYKPCTLHPGNVAGALFAGSTWIADYLPYFEPEKTKYSGSRRFTPGGFSG